MFLAVELPEVPVEHAAGSEPLQQQIRPALTGSQDSACGIDGHGNAILLWDSWRGGWTHGMFAAFHRT